MESNLNCPYQDNVPCRYLDSSAMTQETSCTECELYSGGVRPSKGCLVPAIVLFSFICLLIYFGTNLAVFTISEIMK